MTINEQILLRIGLDSKPLLTGMNRVTSYVKGWGTSLSRNLRGTIMGAVGVAAVLTYFNRAIERITLLKRAIDATGLSAEFLQNAFSKVRQRGADPESLIRPLSVMGEHTDNLNKHLEDMAEIYSKLNTQEERNRFLGSQNIKNWQQLIPLLQGGAAGIREMQKGHGLWDWFWNDKNPTMSTHDVGSASIVNSGFRKFSSGSVDALAYLWAKMSSAVVRFDAMTSVMTKGVQIGDLNKEVDKEVERRLALQKEESKNSETYNKQLEERVKLEHEVSQVEHELADRNKTSVSEMASEYMKMTGAILPRHTVTPLLRQSFNIRKLEERASIAFEHGNSAAHDRFQSEADALRKAGGFTDKDRFPMKETEFKLDQLRILTEPISQWYKQLETPKSHGAGGSW